MLILKGKNGKALFFNSLYWSVQSVCFSYTKDQPSYLPGFWLDSNKYSVNEFKNYLEDYFKNETYPGYILIYTDLLQEDVEKLMWLDCFGTKVIVACF